MHAAVRALYRCVRSPKSKAIPAIPPAALVESLEGRTLLSGGPSVKSILADNRGQAILTFSAPIDPATLTGTNVNVLTAGADGLLNTADDVVVGSAVDISADDKTLTVTGAVPAGTKYRVRLLGGASGITGATGKPIAGNTGALGNYDATTTGTTSTARFVTILGKMNVKLQGNVPNTIANFLSYANEGDWDNTFFHRSEHQPPSANLYVIQGGGFNVDENDQVGSVTAHAPIVKEAGASNTRGTIAMARTSDLNSATNQWFFNTRTNKTLNTTGGGYTVFGKLADSASFKVMNAIAKLPIVNAGGTFTELPVFNYTSGSIDPQMNLAIVSRVAMADTVVASSKAGQIAG